ncbi:MAG: hypothetical protein ACOX5R_17245 [bacterium]|jgi:hypothetical protein
MMGSTYLLISLLWLCALNPMNADVPSITTQLEYSDHATISLRYRALSWGSIFAPAADGSPVSDVSGFAPAMGTISSNVQLTIGTTQLDPGSYEIGFIQRNEQWQVVISSDERVYALLPVIMKEEEMTAPYLMFTLRPGLTGRDFIFTCHYGNLSTAIRWTISGVPVRQAYQQTVAPPGRPPEPGQSTQNLSGYPFLINSVQTGYASGAAISPATSTHTPLRLKPVRPEAESDVNRRSLDLKE